MKNKILILGMLLTLASCIKEATVKAPGISKFGEDAIHERKLRIIGIDIAKANGYLTDYGANLTRLEYEKLYKQYAVYLKYINERNTLEEVYKSRVRDIDTLFSTNGVPLFVNKHDTDITKDNPIIGLNKVLISLDSLDATIYYSR